jgi:hypothetical protein
MVWNVGEKLSKEPDALRVADVLHFTEKNSPSTARSGAATVLRKKKNARVFIALVAFSWAATLAAGLRHPCYEHGSKSALRFC